MKSIHQLIPDCVSSQVFATGGFQCHFHLYSPHPELKIVIFSKITSTGPFTAKEVEALVNMVVKEFKLNPNSVVWIEYNNSRHSSLAPETFSLVTLDWHNGVAANPRSRPICEDWYLTWLDNNILGYVVTPEAEVGIFR